MKGKDDVVTAWLRQSRGSGAEKCGLRFNGPHLIHYSTLIAFRLRDGRLLLNPERYSVSTSRVQYLVRRGSHVLEAPLKGFESADEARIREHLGGEIADKIRAQAVTVIDRGNVTQWAGASDCRGRVHAVYQWQRRAHALINAGVIGPRSIPSRVLNCTQTENEKARQYLKRLATTVFRTDLAEAEIRQLQRVAGASWPQVGAVLQFNALTHKAKQEKVRLARELSGSAEREYALIRAISDELNCALHASHYCYSRSLAACAAMFLPRKHAMRLAIERAAAAPLPLITPPPFNATMVEMNLIANGVPHSVRERVLQAVEAAYAHRLTAGAIPQASLVRTGDGRLQWYAAPGPDDTVYFRF